MQPNRSAIVTAAMLAALCASGASNAQPAPPADSASSGSGGRLFRPAAAPLPGDEPTATRLIAGTNAACRLRVNGTTQEPDLMPGEPRAVVVPPGESTVECTSTTVPGATVKRVVAVAAGSRQSVPLDVAELVVEASCKVKAATLADLGNGVLRHCATRADWTQSDSGPGGLNWFEGKAWCEKKGRGWFLPLPDELAELIDRTGRSRTPCGKQTCNVSPHFRLTGQLFQSSQVPGPELVMVVNLTLGGRHPTGQEQNFEYFALCIRHPS